jgi:outer membrane protein TolC
MKRLFVRLSPKHPCAAAVVAVTTWAAAVGGADTAHAARGAKAKSATTEPVVEAAPPTPTSTPLPSAVLVGGMTLSQAVDTALSARPELAAGRARVQARQSAAYASWGQFIPRLVVGGGVDQSRTPIAGPFTTFFQRDDTLDAQRLVLGAGLVEDLPTGTRIELRADGSVGRYSFYAEALNPRYEPALRLRISQPLMKNLAPDVNLAPIALADASVLVEDAALAARTQAVVLEVVEAWLEASRAATRVLLQQQSVALAENFERLTRQLIEGGSLSRLDLALALQTVAQRQAELSAARADADLAVGRLGEVLGPAPSSTSAPLPTVAALGETSAWVPSLDDVTAQVLPSTPACAPPAPRCSGPARRRR